MAPKRERTLEGEMPSPPRTTREPRMVEDSIVAGKFATLDRILGSHLQEALGKRLKRSDLMPEKPSPLPAHTSKKRRLAKDKIETVNTVFYGEDLEGRAQGLLAKRIQKLPLELQDIMLDHFLAATLPSDSARVTILDRWCSPRKHFPGKRKTFNIPVALRINQKTRTKYAKQFYSRDQLLCIETIGTIFNPSCINMALDSWFELIDPEHRHHLGKILLKFVVQGHAVTPREVRHCLDVSDVSDVSDVEFSMANEYQSHHVSPSMSTLGVLPKPWSSLSHRKKQGYVSGIGLRTCIAKAEHYSLFGHLPTNPARVAALVRSSLRIEDRTRS
ncbi:hypothetical protein TI39_contig5842g00025 [Zymoseptoria brevis]|uniref:Uncharacterized protein n=1 Tax=Zymoseptoria brevis TaxID=1047168 RepID=A0A0F4G671_9PEZI|nr:hypothetical protein TI39_contig5842g00025 [Zymoseptoria brevis]